MTPPSWRVLMSSCLLAGLATLLACGSEPADNGGDASGDDDDDSTPVPSDDLPELNCTEGRTSYEGIVTLTTDDAVDTFTAEYHTVTGSLELSGAAIATAPNLGCLESVQQDFRALDTSLRRVDLRGLRQELGGLRVLDNELLKGIHAPEILQVNQATSVENNPVLDEIDLGSVTVLRSQPSSDDNEALGFAFHIDHSEQVTALNLESVESFGGTVNFADLDMVEALLFPVVLEAHGSVVVDNCDLLQELSAPLLTNIDGQLRIDHNGPPHRFIDGAPKTPFPIDFAAVQSVTEDVYIDNSPAATSLHLGSLQTVGMQMLVLGMISIQQLDLDQLVSVGGELSFREAYSLLELKLGSLSSVQGDLNVEYLGSLPSLQLTALSTVAGSLTVESNESLTLLEMPNLTHVGGDLIIRQNPSLPEAQVTTLLAQLGDDVVQGQITVENNGE